MKKLFIKLAKILGFEIIDQNNFSSPTLNKELNEDLSTLNQKSIILPLGEVKISRNDAEEGVDAYSLGGPLSATLDISFRISNMPNDQQELTIKVGDY